MDEEPIVSGGCCGPDARLSAIPPTTGPPDSHKVNVIWYFGFGFAYLICCLYAFYGYFGNFLFYPLTFLTMFILYQFGYKRFVKDHRINSHRTRLPDLFRAFAQTFFSAGLLALLIELVVSFVIGLIFAENDSNFLKEMEEQNYPKSKSFSTHLYYFLQAFLVAGLIEEYCKGFLLQYTMKLYIHHRKYLKNLDTETVVWLGLSVGLGFGTIEGVLYTCIYGGTTNMLSQLILWLVRVFVAIPFHTIMGIMWGCELAKRDVLKYDTLNNVSFNEISDNNDDNNDANNGDIENNNNINNNIANNNNNNNVNDRSYTGFRVWFFLGIKQFLWHGCYDFIEMEYSLMTASDNIAIEIEMTIIGCIIAIVITVAAGFASARAYKRLVNNSRSELIPDGDDHM